MSPLLLAPLVALLVAQAEPRTAPPALDQAPGAEPARRLSPEDEEVIRNLELLEHLEVLQKLELFDAAGDDADAPAPTDGDAGTKR